MAVGVRSSAVKNEGVSRNIFCLYDSFEEKPSLCAGSFFVSSSSYGIVFYFLSFSVCGVFGGELFGNLL